MSSHLTKPNLFLTTINLFSVCSILNQQPHCKVITLSTTQAKIMTGNYKHGSELGSITHRYGVFYPCGLWIVSWLSCAACEVCRLRVTPRVIVTAEQPLCIHCRNIRERQHLPRWRKMSLRRGNPPLGHDTLEDQVKIHIYDTQIFL